MAKLSESQLYGPVGKVGWDAIESEIDRQCEEAGLSYLEKMHSAFTLDLNTGKITRYVACNCEPGTCKDPTSANCAGRDKQ